MIKSVILLMLFTLGGCVSYTREQDPERYKPLATGNIKTTDIIPFINCVEDNFESGLMASGGNIRTQRRVGLYRLAVLGEFGTALVSIDIFDTGQVVFYGLGGSFFKEKELGLFLQCLEKYKS